MPTGLTNVGGPDEILFSIGSGVQTIRPITALPTLTDPVVIDGTSQPGFAGTPLIELSGNLLTAPDKRSAYLGRGQYGPRSRDQPVHG